MPKFKLEYIWLDGYTPVPNLREQDQDPGIRQLPDPRGAADVGIRRQFDPTGRREEFRLHAETGGGLSRTRPGSTACW